MGETEIKVYQDSFKEHYFATRETSFVKVTKWRVWQAQYNGVEEVEFYLREEPEKEEEKVVEYEYPCYHFSRDERMCPSEHCVWSKDCCKPKGDEMLNRFCQHHSHYEFMCPTEHCTW